MKKRIISGAVFIALWVILLVVNNAIFDTAVVAILSLIATFEYFRAFKNIGYNPVSWLGYAGCLAIFLMGGIIPEEYKLMLIKIIIPVGLISAFAYIILGNVKRTVIDVAITVFSLLYIPFMFSFLKLILGMEYGRFYILYVLCGAFVSDTFAFLVGSKFGKTKLAPDISPNKTVEGSLGGILGVIISFVLLTLLGKFKLGINLNIIYWVIVGIAASVAGQFGDLTASAIKRYCKIKDFGNIMPGHGGILDRFDSLMFVAPIVYIFIKLYI